MTKRYPEVVTQLRQAIHAHPLTPDSELVSIKRSPGRTRGWRALRSADVARARARKREGAA